MELHHLLECNEGLALLELLLQLSKSGCKCGIFILRAQGVWKAGHSSE